MLHDIPVIYSDATFGPLLRVKGRLRGVIENAVVEMRTSPESPPVPMVGARVDVLRAADMRPAWRGMSGADGRYTPRGLEAGVTYIPVAVDASGQFECVAAGPVVARHPANA